MGVTLTTRIRAAWAIKSVPEGPTVTPTGMESNADSAAPPSPVQPSSPSPAMVVMVPPDTIRMRWFIWSAIKRSPSASSATSIGKFSFADVAGPPSPLKPGCLVMPATVVMTWLAWSTRRMV